MLHIRGEKVSFTYKLIVHIIYYSNFHLMLISGEFSVLQVNFNLQRHTGYFLIQVYVPCILIVVLSWVSFWIHREATSDRVGLGNANCRLKIKLASWRNINFTFVWRDILDLIGHRFFLIFDHLKDMNHAYFMTSWSNFFIYMINKNNFLLLCNGILF